MMTQQRVETCCPNSTLSTIIKLLTDKDHFISPYLPHHLPTWFILDICSYNILRGLGRLVFTDVSGQTIGPIFKGQRVQEEGCPKGRHLTANLRCVTSWKSKRSQLNRRERMKSRVYSVNLFSSHLQLRFPFGLSTRSISSLVTHEPIKEFSHSVNLPSCH